MEKVLIAPCGMNCGICSGYLAQKNDLKNKGVRIPYCTGCRPREKRCAFIIKPCNLLSEGKIEYCYECDDFPCGNLRRIDKSYRKKYRMSMIENLDYIRENGIDDFLRSQEEKWKCPDCGAVICCHNGICYNCGLEKLTKKEKIHTWDDE